MADNSGPLVEAIEQVREATNALKSRRLLREGNQAPERLSPAAQKKLDSSMKRNTALIRKLKQLGEDTSKSLLDDIAKTNQSKYVSEAVAAVTEAPLKLRDLAAAVRVCSALHQRYPEFAPELEPALSKIVSGGASGEEDRPSLARRRTTLRLAVDLFLCGAFAAHSTLLSIVRQLASVGTTDFARSPEDALGALSLMAVFAKAGREELLGMPHAEPAALPSDLEARTAVGHEAAAECAAAVDEYRSELAQRWALPGEAQAQFRDAAKRLLDAACAALQTSHEALTQTEADNDKVLNSRGDLPESLAQAYEAQRSAFEALERGAAALAEVLEQQLPELRSTVTRLAETTVIDAGAAGGEVSDASRSPFDDEETRAFYESLPVLREVVPAVLLGEAAEGKAGESSGGDGAAAAAEEGAGEEGDAVAAVEAVVLEDGLGEEDTEQLEEAVAKLCMDDDTPAEESKEEGASKGAMVGVLARLQNCVSKDLCDEVAVEFCYAGGAKKGARKRLGKALLDVPTGALSLLPYYARVAAVLEPLFPDVAAAVCAGLEAEFKTLLRKKDATTRTLEPRLRNARYIAEMVKFQLFPAGTAFLMLKALLDDFSGHNVDAACALVETAGRYLSRRPDTATRMGNMLDVMMKLKNARNLDPRQAGLIESAYFVVKTTAQGPRVKQRPPTHEWVRHLVYARLDAASVPFVLKKLRRLRWEEDGDYVLRTLLRAARKGRFSQLPPLASLAAGLAKTHPWLGVAMVDSVVEEIEAGMESPEAALYQRRVAAVRLLGELYAYKLVNSTLVFNTLHALLAFGHSAGVAPEDAFRLDPPTNFFRIRLVCALLESCGSFFARGVARKRLDAFLPYLQRYVLSKPPLPLDVDLDLQELYSRLKVAPPEFGSYEAACMAVVELEAQAKAEAASGLEIIEEEEEEEEEEGDEDDDGRDEEDEEVESGSEAAAGSELDGSDDDESNSEDEEEDSEEEEDDEDDEDEDEEGLDDDDEEVAQEKTAEEEEFERELALAMGDSGRERARPGVGAFVVGGSGGGVAGPRLGGGSGGGGGGPAASAAAAAAAPSETLALRVMTRRGGRSDRTQELLIPVPATAARQMREKEAAEAAERAELKRMVLAANRREEQESAAAAYAAGQQHRGGGGGQRRHYGGGGSGGYYNYPRGGGNASSRLS